VSACSSDPGESSATKAERAVCSSLQDMVDDLAADSPTALDQLDALEQAVAESGNDRLRASGESLFTINDTVPNAGDLTVQESAALGDQALRTAQTGLGGLIDGCVALGIEITNLPTEK
jgi:hypothetical protein